MKRFRIVRSERFGNIRPWLLIDWELDEPLWFDSRDECLAEIRQRLAAEETVEEG